MSVIWILIAISILLATAAGAAFVWANRSGQYDDLEAPAARVVFDEHS